MKTAEEIILEIKELSREERKKVADYLQSEENDDFQEEHYSPEDISRILKAGEEAEKGIGVSPELEGEEAVDYLRKLRNA